VSTEGFSAAGERLAALGRPTVLVHEGGYELARLGVDTVALLSAFRPGAT
jgi:acetoin utilization deacetylase AcuC-like enzyme